MNILFKIWGRGMLIYTGCMLPFLLIPPIFAFAIVLAVIYGSIAFILFSGLMYLVRIWISSRVAGLLIALLIGLAATFVATYFACLQMRDGNQTVWDAMVSWILFPAVAWCATLLAVVTYRNSIAHFFFKKTTRYVL